MITPYQCPSLFLGNPLLPGGGGGSLPGDEAWGQVLQESQGEGSACTIHTLISLHDEHSQQVVSLLLYSRMQELGLEPLTTIHGLSRS